MSQCLSLTKGGKQCKRNAIGDGVYCRQHADTRSGSLVPKDNGKVVHVPMSQTDTAIENLRKDVKKRVETRRKSEKYTFVFRNTMARIADHVAVLLSTHGNRNLELPGIEATPIEWVEWYSEIRLANKDLSKRLSMLDTQATYALYLLTMGMNPKDASEYRNVLKSEFNLGASTFKQVSSMCVNFTPYAIMVADGQIAPSSYRKLARWVKDHGRLDVLQKALDDKRPESELLLEWVNEYADSIVVTKDGKRVVTQASITAAYEDCFTGANSDQTDAILKSSKGERRAEEWSSRVAFGKTTIAEIPNDIQGRTLELVYDKLRGKGVTVISQGSRLYPVYTALRDERTSLAGLEEALHVIGQVKEILEARANAILTLRAKQKQEEAKQELESLAA